MSLSCLLLVPAFAQEPESQNPSKAEPQAKTSTTSKKTKEPPPKSTEPPTPPEEPKPEPASSDKSKDKEQHFDMAEVPPVVTHHEITVNGKTLHYTATAGRLPIKREDGKIEAQMFFVAYTLDDQQVNKRPLTFAFNGGPGSSSVWLHMGALGPKRVVLQPDGFMPPAPYRLADNPYTLLDKSDLVLVDAIGTGSAVPPIPRYSRNSGEYRVTSKRSANLFASTSLATSAGLRRSILFGESYGTTRSAGIAGYLCRQGHSFNGITLLSTVLNFETLISNKTNDLPYVFLVPSFTMIAGYHHKLPPDLAQDMNQARQESNVGVNRLRVALDKGDALTPEERQKTINQLARYTGLSKQLIDEANLRVDVSNSPTIFCSTKSARGPTGRAFHRTGSQWIA